MTAIVNECVERIGTLGQSHAPPSSPGRNSAHQQDRRQEEHLTRRRVATVSERLVAGGLPWSQVANWLHLPLRTLGSWRHDLDCIGPPRLLGRPLLRSSRDRRNEVIHLLDEIGPHLGVPTLREHFPTMCRAELADLVQRYRAVWRERHRQPLRILHWTTPGRVWAIDFAEAPAPIDGRFSYLLAVRDIASSMQLLWQPIEAPTAEAAAAVLAPLFVLHGAPLVLKCDNGSPFGAPAVQDQLAQHRVATLFSPPGMPRYNGAIEAGIGSHKKRTDAAAGRAGHPGVWTVDDLATAQCEANFSGRPRGLDGPSPELIWFARTPITEPERLLFRSRSEDELVEVKLREAAAGACEMTSGDVWSERAMARVAIRRTLETCGYLTYQRRRIPPTIRRPKVAIIP